MLHTVAHRKMAPAGIVALSLLMLTGIITMGYGYYHSVSSITTAGFLTTIATAWTILSRTLSDGGPEHRA